MNRTFLIYLSAMLLSGCTTTYLGGIGPQTHYDYPNSNVYPLGYAKGQASITRFLFPPRVTSALQYDAISNALEQQPGADMLINTIQFVDTTDLPMLPIYTLTYRIEGTAVKMKDVGIQNLH